MLKRFLYDAVVFATAWMLVIIIILGAEYTGRITTVSYVTGTSDGHWTDTGSDIRPTTDTYAVRIIGNLTCEDVLFEDATTSGDITQGSGDKLICQDWAATGPLMWTFHGGTMFSDQLSSGATATTSGVQTNTSWGISRMIFDLRIPGRLFGGKVVLDRFRIYISGTDDATYLWRTRFMRQDGTIELAQGRPSNGTSYVELLGDVYLEDEVGYYLQMDWIDTDGMPDEMVYRIIVRAHTE